jgi:hypothetical protein
VHFCISNQTCLHISRAIVLTAPAMLEDHHAGTQTYSALKMCQVAHSLQAVRPSTQHASIPQQCTYSSSSVLTFAEGLVTNTPTCKSV